MSVMVQQSGEVIINTVNSEHKDQEQHWKGWRRAQKVSASIKEIRKGL